MHSRNAYDIFKKQKIERREETSLIEEQAPRNIKCLLLLAALMVASCNTTSQNVVVDIKSSKPNATRLYAQDISDCKTLAKQVGDGGAGDALLGLMAGAVIGGVTGQAIGGGSFAASGAAYGAAVGTAKGTVTGARNDRLRKETALDRCMTGRGYSVVGVGEMLADQYIPIKFEGGVILAPTIPGSSAVMGYAEPDIEQNRITVAREVDIYEECERLAISQQFTLAAQWDGCLDTRNSIQPRSKDLKRK